MCQPRWGDKGVGTPTVPQNLSNMCPTPLKSHTATSSQCQAIIGTPAEHHVRVCSEHV